MPKAYSTDLRMRVIAAMQAGATCRAVAASFDIAPSTAGKWEAPKSPGSSCWHCGVPPATLLHDGCPDSAGRPKRTEAAHMFFLKSRTRTTGALAPTFR